MKIEFEKTYDNLSGNQETKTFQTDMPILQSNIFSKIQLW